MNLHLLQQNNYKTMNKSKSLEIDTSRYIGNGYGHFCDIDTRSKSADFDVFYGIQTKSKKFNRGNIKITVQQVNTSSIPVIIEDESENEDNIESYRDNNKISIQCKYLEGVYIITAGIILIQFWAFYR